MTAPSQLGAVYPPLFASSFWTFPDYRKGATVLYSRIQEGLDENESVLGLLRHRAQAERAYAAALMHVPAHPCESEPLFPGATSVDRAGYRSRATGSAQAMRQIAYDMGAHEAPKHAQAAKHLEASIIKPFGQWVHAHDERVRRSWWAIDDALNAMESQAAEVVKARTTYETRCWHADEAGDDTSAAPYTDRPLTDVPDAAPHSADTETLSSSPPPPLEKSEAAEAPSGEQTQRAAAEDKNKLQRRETLRQQFGFKSKEARQDAGLRDTDEKSQAPGPDKMAAEGEHAKSSRLSSYFSFAVGQLHDSSTLAHVRAAVKGLADPRPVRLRKEADIAEQAYRKSVQLLDALRCRAEEVLTVEYHRMQKWELDRLVALQRVIEAYELALASLGSDRLVSSIRAWQPKEIVDTMVSEYRTGSYQPAPAVFKPYYHDEATSASRLTDTGFGADLMLAAKHMALANPDGDGSSAAAMPTLPPVLHALLSALQRSYVEQARWVVDGEPMSAAQRSEAQRRVWLYEPPLDRTHKLRQQLMEHYAQYTDASTAARFAPDPLLDATAVPVLAGTVKLWLLELESSLVPSALWDEIEALYEAAEIRAMSLQASNNAQNKNEEIAETLRSLSLILAKVPKLQLVCLDALAAHLYKLVKDTAGQEVDDAFTAKLGLALGRAVLRPPSGLPSLAFSLAPAAFFNDLVLYYETLFPPLMLTKAQEYESQGLSPFRAGVARRASTLVDQRIKHSSLQGKGLPSHGGARPYLEPRHFSAPGSRPSPSRALRPLSMLQSTSPSRKSDASAPPLSLPEDTTSISPTDRPSVSESAETHASAGQAKPRIVSAPVGSRDMPPPSRTTSREHVRSGSVSERRKLFENQAAEAQKSAPAPRRLTNEPTFESAASGTSQAQASPVLPAGSSDPAGPHAPGVRKASLPRSHPVQGPRSLRQPSR